MAKISISDLRVPEAVTDTREFADPQQPGKVISLRFLAQPDFNSAVMIGEMTRGHIAQYAQPKSIGIYMRTPKGNVRIPITEVLCQHIATIQALEQPDENGEKYTFEDWARINYCMRTAFGLIRIWAQDLMERASGVMDDNGDVKVPNDSAVSTDNTSAAPQNITPVATPL